MAIRDELTALQERAGDAADGILTFLTRAFGLRSPHAEPLAPLDHARLVYSVRTIILVTIVLSASFGFLTYNIYGVFTATLDGTDPLPDLKRFIDGLLWHEIACVGIGIAAVFLLIWMGLLRRQYQVNWPAFLIPIVPLVACIFFRPLAVHRYRSSLVEMHDKGSALFDQQKYDECYDYFDRWYPVIRETYVADNALGRLAGCEYWRGNYAAAIDLYSRVLSEHPNTDIRQSTITSIEWSLTKFGATASFDEIVEIYDSKDLDSYGIPVFRFLLGGARPHEPISLNLYDSLTGSRRRLALQLLDRYPDDLWAARIAFWAGLDDRLRGDFRDTEYGMAFLVIEGLHLHRLQQFDAAAAKYAAYLEARHDSTLRERVRELLAVSHLGNPSLESVFANLVDAAGTPYDISPRIDARVLGRFAFHRSVDDMLTVAEKYGPIVPVHLAIDMYTILAERLELENRPALAASYLAEVDRLTLLEMSDDELARAVGSRRGQIGRNSAPRIRDILASTFRSASEDGATAFVNSRLFESRTDARKLHLLDRWYASHANAWSGGADGVSYTDLLLKHAQALIETELSEKPEFETWLAAARAYAIDLEEPRAGRDAVATGLLRRLDDDAPLTTKHLAQVAELGPFELDDLLDTFSIRVINDLTDASGSLDALTLRRLFSAIEISNRPRAVAHARKVIADGVLDMADDAGTRFARVTEVDRLLRSADLRFRLEEQIIPVLANAYSTIGDPAYEGACAQGLRELGVYCLRSPRLFPMARLIFEQYIVVWPDDAFRENCESWLGWLWAFEANKLRATPHLFDAAYAQSLRHYDWIIRNGEQSRVVVNARGAARRIRLKLGKAASGLVRRTDFDIPKELYEFGFAPARAQVHGVSAIEPLPAEFDWGSWDALVTWWEETQEARDSS